MSQPASHTFEGPGGSRDWGAPDDRDGGFGGYGGSQETYSDGLAGRITPHDNDAEVGALGSMMLSKDAIGEVLQHIKGPDFYRPAHEAIFDAIIHLYSKGEPADQLTVAAELTRRGELVRVGGAPYVHDLAAAVPIAANAEFYAAIVREKAIQRRLVAAGTKIAQLGYSGEGDIDATVDMAQEEVYRVSEARSSEDYAPLSVIMPETLDEIEAIASHDGSMRGIPTGLSELDQLTNGFQSGQMIIVAARPGVGKSTLALDFCRAAAIANNLTTCFFSLEMGKSEITMKLLSAEARVQLGTIRGGGMTESDWQRLGNKMGTISSAPMFIDDSPNMTMMEIRAKARRLKERHDLRLMVIDYIQLMSSGKKVESRQLEVSEFSRQIKLLAKELEIPIVALSQLNRGSEQRQDKRPQISDLRESGSLEQDADIVILLHRPDMYDKETERMGEADIIVAKHRNGPTKDIPVSFHGHYSRFAELNG